MAELKTQRTDESVEAFIDSLEGEARRSDARELARLMQADTGDVPAMWGKAIVGFGHRRLKYPNGRELDWMALGFSPRKASLSLYLPGGLERLQALLQRLGSHKVVGGCLHIKRLADVDLDVLSEVVKASLETIDDLKTPLPSGGEGF